MKQCFKALSIGLLCLAAATSHAQNLIPNGNFESDTTGWALAINNTAAAGAATASMRSAAAAHTGSYGARVQVTAAQGSSNNWYIQLKVPTDNVVLAPNRSYKLTYWVKSTLASTYYGAFQVKMETTSYQNLAVSKSWTQGQAQASTGDVVTSPLVMVVSLGTDTGTFDFDDFVLEDIGPSKGPASIAFAAKPAWETGIYRNLFTEYGYSQAKSDEKVASTFNQLFFGDSATQRLYRIVPGDTTKAFIDATDYVLTEGQSYGMTIAVQMNRKDIFDKLWKFAKLHMQQKSGDNKGYFAWKVSSKSPFTPSDVNPAPDGEEYFVTSLYLADKRWGSTATAGDMLNYKEQADSILTYMVTSRASLGPLVDPASKQIVFSPAGNNPFTDPSYHLPAFYKMWGAFASHNNALWNAMADTSVAFFLRASNNSPYGIMPNYATFAGTPAVYASAQVTDSGSNAQRTFRYDTTYGADAHRTPMNIGAWWNWFQTDTNAFSETDKFLAFLRSKGGATLKYNQVYSITGLPCAPDGWSPGESQVGSNAAAVLASRDTANWAFVRAAFDQPTPTGQYRYYNGMVYMLAILHISGNFKAWGSPGMILQAGVDAKPLAIAPRALLSGRTLSLSGLSGSTVRLLDAQGRLSRTAPVVAGAASFTVPARGLWIVESGRSRSIVTAP
ncbi:MAG: carbohydrate binding domain-containing protein [Fibrobacterota bacterium]|nr:carbohydrate binding domain-containing protein [Fibrobacterota bacterium]QQS05970.1 MAG: carbohydrate binding domain-containing protein [Fibrobacterota bacterium]